MFILKSITPDKVIRHSRQMEVCAPNSAETPAWSPRGIPYRGTAPGENKAWPTFGRRAVPRSRIRAHVPGWPNGPSGDAAPALWDPRRSVAPSSNGTARRGARPFRVPRLRWYLSNPFWKRLTPGTSSLRPGRRGLDRGALLPGLGHTSAPTFSSPLF